MNARWWCGVHTTEHWDLWRDAHRMESLGVVDCEFSHGLLALVRERLGKSVLIAQHGLGVWVFGENRRELGLEAGATVK
jgi:hypothetical protein